MQDLIRRYSAGADIATLAAECGVEPQTIRKRLKKAGVVLRTSSESKRLHMPPIDAAALVADYAKGESVNSLSKRTGVDRSTIARTLAPFVQLRGQSEAERMKWSRMDASARAKQTAAAHVAASAAFAGKPPSFASLVGKANLWQRTSRMNATEIAFHGMLLGLGLPCVPQYAVGAYNLDFAMTGLPVAVEVITSYVAPLYGPKLRRKVESLLNGWHFIFAIVRTPADLAAVRETLPSWLDRARRDQTVVGHYGVIHGQTKHATGLERYLDGLPRVDGPHSAVDDPPDPLPR